MVKKKCVRLRAQIRRSLQCRSSPGSRRNLLAKATTIHLSPKKILHTSKRRLSFGAYTAQHRTRNISAHFHVFSATLDPFLHIFCHFLYTARYFLSFLCMFLIICQIGTTNYSGFEKKSPACFAGLTCFAVVRTKELYWDWMSFSSRCSRQRLVLPSSALCLQLAFIAMKKSKESGFRIEFSALLCLFCKAGL